MARRSFHRRHQTHPISELNVIPLIDLAFALLIIFMISTPLITKNERTVPLDLPVSTVAPPKKPDVRFVSITIIPGGYNVDGTVMTGGQLDARLRDFGRTANPPVFSIRADRNVPYQEVVTLLDLLSRNNLSKISLDTQSNTR
jgi:biopolymer transport protein ExbD